MFKWHWAPSPFENAPEAQRIRRGESPFNRRPIPLLTVQIRNKGNHHASFRPGSLSSQFHAIHPTNLNRPGRSHAHRRGCPSTISNRPQNIHLGATLRRNQHRPIRHVRFRFRPPRTPSPLELQHRHRPQLRLSEERPLRRRTHVGYTSTAAHPSAQSSTSTTTTPSGFRKATTK